MVILTAIALVYLAWFISRMEVDYLKDKKWLEELKKLDNEQNDG